MHLDFWLKLPEKLALAEGLIELDQPCQEKSCQFCSYTATAGRTRLAGSTDLGVVAKVHGGALPADD